MKIGAQINGECVCDTVEIKEFICNMHNHTLTHTHGSELGFLRRVWSWRNQTKNCGGNKTKQINTVYIGNEALSLYH